MAHGGEPATCAAAASAGGGFLLRVRHPSNAARVVPLLGLFLLPCLAVAVWAEDAKEKPMVQDGKRVSIEYTLKLDDGSTADTNVGREPLTYTQGQGQILPALENALEGLAVDDSKAVTLPPEQGYGTVDPERVQTVPVDQIPEGAREVGAQLVAADEQGRRIPVRVKEVRDDAIVVDLNHPLAGETLHFDVKVVEIQ